MRKLSAISVFLFNPLLGFIILVSFMSGYIWLTPIFMYLGYLNLKFYFRTHPETHDMKKFRETHSYVGEGYMTSYYINNETKEIVEV